VVPARQGARRGPSNSFNAELWRYLIRRVEETVPNKRERRPWRMTGLVLAGLPVGLLAPL
jgi:hypothetical protein